MEIRGSEKLVTCITNLCQLRKGSMVTYDDVNHVTFFENARSKVSIIGTQMYIVQTLKASFWF